MPTLKSWRPNKWQIALAVTGLLLAALLAGIPYGAKYMARQWLLENGGSEVRFSDIDFNPFWATLELEDLEVKVNRETTLSFATASLDLDWLPLFDKQISIASLELTDVHLLIDNRDTLKIGGIHTPPEESTPAPVADSNVALTAWLSGIDRLTLRDFHLIYRDDEIETDLLLDRLHLTHFAQWNPGESTQLEFSGRLNGADIEMGIELAPLADQPQARGTLAVRGLELQKFAGLAKPFLEELRKFEGAASLESEFSLLQTQQDLTLTHEGSLSLAGLELTSGDIQLSAQRGDWTGELSLTQIGDGVIVSHTGTVILEQMKMVSDDGIIDNASANWRGSTALQQDGQDASLKLRTEGTLLVGHTTADLSQPQLYFEQEQFSHEGNFSYIETATDPRLELNADIHIQGLRVAAEERKYKLLSIDVLDLNSLQVDETNKLTIDAVDTSGLFLAQNDAPENKEAESEDGEAPEAFLQIATMQVRDTEYADDLLSIDVIEYEGWHTQLNRTPQGQWAMVRLLDVIARIVQQDPAEPGNAAHEPADSTSAGLQFAVNRIEVTGGNSTLNIIDESVTPAFTATLDIETLKVSNIDSLHPDQPTSLVVGGKIGKYTSIALQGDLQPFLQTPDMDLQGTITAMDLPALSSYTRESLGLLLDSGTLDAEFGVTVQAEKIDGKATLELHQLELETLPGDDTLQSNIPVPLNTALGTLRDKNNDIELEIPVTGDINDPQFNINNAINQALANGVRSGALGYLTFMLQPYGSLITAARYAGEAATKVRLNPVEFEPGQSQLDNNDREYLSKVAKVLDDRPNINIKLCGVVVEQDRLHQAQQQATETETETEITVDEVELVEIARQRAATVKGFLAEKYQVSASRLVGCAARLELESDEAKPRTDLLI